MLVGKYGNMYITDLYTSALIQMISDKIQNLGFQIWSSSGLKYLERNILWDKETERKKYKWLMDELKNVEKEIVQSNEKIAILEIVEKRKVCAWLTPDEVKKIENNKDKLTNRSLIPFILEQDFIGEENREIDSVKLLEIRL